jgi:diaminohydroxyphosphoribosylaminopyrimidine deaminase/5-amino-6-(5-phosphoribosylamino)uracil reductase
VTAEDDRRHMRHALGLAARGLGNVWPNPAVGCVILKEGRVLGRGWTQPGGRPHAERMALDQAGDRARGATAYVTLEPCAHHGKTPPCAEALIAAGVARVVTALTDPDPRVAGRGHAMLREAGIDVVEGVEAEAARRLNQGFLSRVTTGLPLVTLKIATTIDGRIATASGESRWITGPAARRMVHAMRLSHDAVMVGSGTARADDPDLTVRDLGAVHQPVRIVLDSRLSLSTDSRLGRTARQVPVWMCHGPNAPAASLAAWAETGAVLVPCSALPDGSLDVRSVLLALGVRGLTRVFCEGGGQLAGSLLRAGAVEELVAFAAGKIIGADGVPAVGPIGLTRLADAPGFSMASIEVVGPDCLIRWRRA